MARPLRIEFEGALYHITSRGNAKQAIFADDLDRHGFLELISQAVDRFHWICHAYCLMRNHYHLLVETPEANLSRGMREINGSYTQFFNRRHRRAGHLFEGRYKAILVAKEQHLLSLSRYVVLNPVRAGLVQKPEEWRWSSYRATIGLAEKPSFLTVDWILSQWGTRKKAAAERYSRFVREGIGGESPWKDLKGQVFLGGEEFVRGLAGALDCREDLKEIPKIQRYAGRPSLNEIFKEKSTPYMEDIVYQAYVRYGYTMREIAAFMGVHYCTVSRAIKRAEAGRRGCLIARPDPVRGRRGRPF